MFTYEGAYTSFAEKERGTLYIGNKADLVVLEKDVFTQPKETLQTIQVILTMVEGKIVYQKE